MHLNRLLSAKMLSYLQPNKDSAGDHESHDARHLFHGNLPSTGALVDDELYKVRIASHIARVSEDKFKN